MPRLKSRPNVPSRVIFEQWNIPEVSPQVNHHPPTGNLRNVLCVTERGTQQRFGFDTKVYL